MITLQRFGPDVTAETIAHTVRTDGACVVEDLVPPELVAQVAAEIYPQVELTPTGSVSFAGLRTRRTGGLMGRSAAARSLITHPLVLAAGRQILSKAPSFQLMNTEIISIGPGEPAQPMHRDQDVWAYPFPAGFEPEFSVMWPLTPFTLENGATRIVLGSHREGQQDTWDESDIQQATMTPGSVLVWTGSVFHSGGANRSDETRHGVNVAYALGWLRQEENQYLAVPPDVAASLTDDELRLMGYERGGPGLGNGVDRSHPLGAHRPALAQPGVIDPFLVSDLATGGEGDDLTLGNPFADAEAKYAHSDT